MKGLIKTVSYADKFSVQKKSLKNTEESSGRNHSSPRKCKIQIVDDKNENPKLNSKQATPPKSSIIPKKSTIALETWSHSDLSQSETGDQADDNVDRSLNFDNNPINSSADHAPQSNLTQTKSEIYRHPAFNPQFKSKGKALRANEKSKVKSNVKLVSPNIPESESRYSDIMKQTPLPQLPSMNQSTPIPIMSDRPESSSSQSSSRSRTLSGSSSSTSSGPASQYNPRVSTDQHQHANARSFKHKSLNVELVETEIQKLEREICPINTKHSTTIVKSTQHELTNAPQPVSTFRDKPRLRVDYTPCSLEEYRLTKPHEYVEITPRLRPGKTVS